MNKDISIKFQNVSKSYEKNGKNVVDNISFEINKGEFITILGSSGSGKTTTLKMINKLVKASYGEIYINGKNLKDTDTINLRRSIGYVIQEIGLFPHLTIYDNISLLLKIEKKDTSYIDERVKELMKLIDLDFDGYAKQYPNQLSGGEKQRVGVARALATNPDIMLLDEPFGAIDAITRMYLQKEIKKIHQELTYKTFVLITHDINEALLLGNRVLIMNEGKIEQFDTPDNILKKPNGDYVKTLLKTSIDELEIWRKYL